MSKTPTTLIIMDGFGIAPDKVPGDNAIAAARTPNLDRIFGANPCCKLSASGLDVGLPEGQMGNSEVGHTNIGAGRVVVAYEPIWAIGTGKTATAEQAGAVCGHIRGVIRKEFGARIARAVTIQYGGSMNAKNAAELLAQPDIDGGLIGGAALKPDDFMAIINAANQE